MPRRDGTGPMGMGQITGRGNGLCAGKNGQGNGQRMRNGQDNRFGNGRGIGRGLNCNAVNNLAPPQKDELTILKDQSNAVENHLNTIKNRISELEQ